MASGQYHVFVEGPIETHQGADMALAAAMQQRYGLPAADVLARMRKGRFRVKGNIDKRTADAYAKDLATIGARVVVTEDGGSRGNTGPIDLHGSTPPAGVPRAATPPGGTPRVAASARVVTTPSSGVPRASTPPSGTPRLSTPPRGSKIADDPATAKTLLSTSAGIPRASTLPVAAPRPPAQPAAALPASTPPTVSQQIRSGLAAAYSERTAPPASLGALDSVGDLSLAALDGSDAAPPPPAAPPTFEPPEPPPELKPPVVKFAPSRPSPPVMPAPSKPLDLFAPPAETAGADALSLDVTTPQPTPVPTSPPLRKSEPSLAKAPAEPPALVAVGPPRWRFAAGLVLAIVLGFVPAHLVASMRERSADKAIDDKVTALYEQATTEEAYAGLDAALAPLRARKQTAHRNSALLALLIWAAAGGAIGYVWFRRIPWRT